MTQKIDGGPKSKKEKKNKYGTKKPSFKIGRPKLLFLWK